MEAMEASGYKEGGTIDSVGDCERGFVVLHGLQEGEVAAENDC